MENGLDIVQMVVNSAPLVYIILKLHRLDKKVDVMDTRLEYIENHWSDAPKTIKKKK
jgi:hypothetical protein